MSNTNQKIRTGREREKRGETINQTEVVAADADTQLRTTPPPPSVDDHLKIYLRWCISDEVSNAVSMIVSISFLCCTYETKERIRKKSAFRCDRSRQVTLLPVATELVGSRPA